eukprot:scaffold65_cov233-Pinguiococcus_pyrenoidosus.AAC.7
MSGSALSMARAETAQLGLCSRWSTTRGTDGNSGGGCGRARLYAHHTASAMLKVISLALASLEARLALSARRGQVTDRGDARKHCGVEAPAALEYWTRATCNSELRRPVIGESANIKILKIVNLPNNGATRLLCCLSPHLFAQQAWVALRSLTSDAADLQTSAAFPSPGFGARGVCGQCVPEKVDSALASLARLASRVARALRRAQDEPSAAAGERVEARRRADRDRQQEDRSKRATGCVQWAAALQAVAPGLRRYHASVPLAVP